MYNWSEFQSHISLNDIWGQLYHQRKVFEALGVPPQPNSVHLNFEKALDKTINKSFFGFLKGLAINVYQLWVFSVCIYVTLGFLVFHCLPRKVAKIIGFSFSDLFKSKKKQKVERNRRHIFAALATA